MKKSVEDRLWSKIVTSDDPERCWIWTAGRNSSGYGEFHVKAGLQVRAHRFVYELLLGPIPAGMTLDHLCHTADLTCVSAASCPHRRCVNPAHLEPVANTENIRRGGNTRKSRCLNGHPLDKVRPDGKRYCSTCDREYMRPYMEQRRRAAGIPPRGSKSRCSRGHEFSGSNLYISPKDGKRRCAVCKRLRDQARRTPRQKPSACAAGHPYDAANTRIRSNGSWACRACARRNTQKYRARRAAQ